MSKYTSKHISTQMSTGGTSVAQVSFRKPNPVVCLDVEIAHVSFRKGKAMNVGDILSNSLMKSAGTNQMEARPAISSLLFQPQPLIAKIAKGMPNGSTVDHDNSHDRAPAGNLRSVVERRFKRMDEAHDRIRTELLCSHAQETE